MKIKSFIRLLSLLLCLLLMLSTLSGCVSGGGGDATDTEKTEAGEYRVNVSSYRLIRPVGASELLIEQATRLKKAIDAKAGAGIEYLTDRAGKPEGDPEEACEILLGKTDRSLSSDAFASLGGKQVFSLTLVGKSIVIATANEALTEYAVDFFIEKYLSGESTVGYFDVPADLAYTSAEFSPVTLVNSSVAEYSIIYPFGSNENMMQVWLDFKNEIDKLTGERFVMPYEDDKIPSDMTYDKEKKEILLGKTAEPETAEALAELAPDEYGIFKIGNKICAVGHTKVTSALAAKKLTVMIAATKMTDSAGKVDLSLFCDEPRIWKYEGYFSEAPKFTAGSYAGALDCDDDVLATYYDATNKADFDAYCASLEASGFVKYSSSDLGGNLFASYKGSKGNIHISLDPKSGRTKILTEKSTLHLAPIVEGETFEKIAEPSVTILTLSYSADNTNGLGLIFRLSDGSFLIYDGGFSADGETVMNALNELNVTGKKPVVRMWLLTHMHGDHVRAFAAFSSNHAKDIELDYVVCNSAGAYYDKDKSGIATPDKIRKYVQAFSGAKMIKVHDGTVMQFADAKVEILQTQEALYPHIENLGFGNDTSVVSRVTLGGQTVILPGDIQVTGGNTLCATYGDYLKSDIVQISHHGSIKYPTTVDFYRLVDAKYAFFPGSAQRFSENSSTPENKFIISRVGLQNVLVADGGNITLNLPYIK